MDIQEVKALGFELFKKFDIKDVHLLFDAATARCGCCRSWYDAKGNAIKKNGIWAQIIISTRFAINNSFNDVNDCLRHEIAHHVTALRHGRIKGIDGKRDSHGLAWKKIALEFGATPKSCSEAYIPKFYQLVCSNERCKMKGKKQAEVNKSGNYLCKSCKTRMAVIPNSGGKIQSGIGEVILFD